VPGLSDEDLAERIRADQVDMLFDLASHAMGNRLLVFARKPAPIQIAWAGPTGLSAMDYLLTDSYLVPPGEERHYRETVLRLPDAYACYERPADAPPVGPLPALQRGYVTFGSSNNLSKITPRVIRTWAQILGRVPNARLVLRYGAATANRDTQQRFGDLFAAAGIEADRLHWVGWTPYAQRFDVYGEIDLTLDPFPFSGCTTTCESLWMGVPVVTCPGENYLSRQSLSVLRNVGCDGTVAQDPSDYVDRAVALADDLPRLAALRAGLRSQMASSGLCDGPRFAHHLGLVLRNVWSEWCRRAAPPSDA
jgi:predicted O-linked N-acetylglucosamine transferase (SPINDLY family)